MDKSVGKLADNSVQKLVDKSVGKLVDKSEDQLGQQWEQVQKNNKLVWRKNA